MYSKGPALEEVVREYFSRQGFFALRGVSVQFEGEEVTDIDAWLYGRQSAGVRTRIIVDAKNKRSPKAFERILWTRGLQLALGCDRGIVATTDDSAKVARFAQQQKVALLSTKFLTRVEKKVNTTDRLSSEQFDELIRGYTSQKQDGDWVGRMKGAKSAVVSLPGYPAFNSAMGAFRFFAERAETRPQHREQAVRCAYFTAALACVALDSALGQVVYEDVGERSLAIIRGVTYGDSGDGKVRSNIGFVLEVISKGTANGRVVANQAQDALDKLFKDIRAEIIAEHFSKEHNASALFGVARELEEHAHIVPSSRITELSVEAKSVLGVFADFVKAKRLSLLSVLVDRATEEGTPPPVETDEAVVGTALSGSKTEDDAQQPSSQKGTDEGTPTSSSAIESGSDQQKLL